MGWPRKSAVCRLYRETQVGSFLLVFVPKNHVGNYDAIGNALLGPDPSPASCTASPAYLRNHCRRVQWSDLPEHWQQAFRLWLSTPPGRTRGFWKVGLGTRQSNTPKRQEGE